MGNFELQFDRIDVLDTPTETRKPFPVDFSFDKDGSLRDHVEEEVTKEPKVSEPIEEPTPELTPEEDDVDFTDVFDDMEFEETDIPVPEEPERFEPEEEPETLAAEETSALEEVPALEQEPEVEEIQPEEEEDVPVVLEASFEEDDDEDVDFADVFGDIEFEETDIPVPEEPELFESEEEPETLAAEEAPTLEEVPVLEQEPKVEETTEEVPQAVLEASFEEDDDEDVDFADVFGDMEFEETEISVTEEPEVFEMEEPEAFTAEEAPYLEETEEEIQPEVEEIQPEEEEDVQAVLEASFEEDDEDVDFADVFGDMEFEETEISVTEEPEVFEMEEPETFTAEEAPYMEETEEEIQPEVEETTEEVPQAALEAPFEEDDDDVDFADVFGDMEVEETEISVPEEPEVFASEEPEISTVEEVPVLEQEPEAEEITEEVTQTVPEASFEEDNDEDFTDVFGDIEFEETEVPKANVSVTTWERVRQRASATESKSTYETEHFFAVEGNYLDAPEKASAESPKKAPETLLSQITDIRPEDEPETEIQPIWKVDEADEDEDELPEEFSDEDLDYDDVFNDDVAKYRKKKRTKSIFKKIFKEFMLFLVIVVGAVFLVANFTIFASRQNTVVGKSMEPTLHGGDHVSTTLFPYIFGEPEIGDIIVFDRSMHGKDMGYFHMLGEVLRNNRIAQWIFGEDDMATDTYWIKRVVAVPGDEVSFEDGKFLRNGEIVEEDYILEQTVIRYTDGDRFVVPEGHVFVMGDNRNHSEDSRAIGCISTDIIIGKVWKKS